jgi:hypothetical protein
MGSLMKAGHNLKEFESEKVAGSCGKLHNERLQDLYSSSKSFWVLY